jgi:hypothetical protein
MKIKDLPTLGADLEGGTFEGLTTRKDGTHCAVVLLPDRAKNHTWKKATDWAQKLGGELPTRPVAALLFTNAKAKLKPQWHWTEDEYDAKYAWTCDFHRGHRHIDRKSDEVSAVAVRLIPLGE